MNYIYILREREFMRLGQDVYKLGRTTQRNLKRLLQHSKGSELLFQSICSNCRETETGLRAIFMENYRYRDDFGTKYFEGCIFEMIVDICTYLREHIDDEIGRQYELAEHDSDESEEESDEDEDEDEDEAENDEDEDDDENAMDMERKEVDKDDEDEDDDEEEVFIVEKIVGHHNIQALSDGAEFVVKWKGFAGSENTMESWNALKHTTALFKYITKFQTSKWLTVRNALFADIESHGSVEIRNILHKFLHK